MSPELPQVPAGSGKHPITLVVISAHDLAASSAFYSKLFGWRLEKLSEEMTGGLAPAGPAVALRSDFPAGSPGLVPYLGASDAAAHLDRLVAAGGAVAKAPWTVPGVGRLARFKDPSGTVYGLSENAMTAAPPRMPVPFGSAPKPPAGAICSLEMYAADGTAAARFFGEQFGWGSLAMMPQYMSFDPGTGVAGVFQSHTPALPAVAYLYAIDVDAKLAEIEASGGKRIGEAMKMPGMATFGYFTDPSGTTMGLIGP